MFKLILDVFIILVGPVCISGLRLEPDDKSVLFAKQQSAKKKSFLCTEEERLHMKILGKQTQFFTTK